MKKLSISKPILVIYILGIFLLLVIFPPLSIEQYNGANVFVPDSLSMALKFGSIQEGYVMKIYPLCLGLFTFFFFILSLNVFAVNFFIVSARKGRRINE